MANDLMVIGENVRLEIRDSAIALPVNYSVDNALKSAFLMISTPNDKGMIISETCNAKSIQNALLDMIVQGLNPVKKQCYFIGYGPICKCQRSYMGSIAVAKDVNSKIYEIRAQVIRQGDNLPIKNVNGKRIIGEHEQTFESLSGEIIGAYAIAVDEQENQIYTDIMTMDQIKKAWNQTPLKNKPVMESGKINPNTTHGKFPEEMAKKTIYHRICKMIINTSKDDNLLAAVDRTEEMSVQEVVQEEIQQNANKKVIDFKPEHSAQGTGFDPSAVDEAAAMATPDQGTTIKQLEKQANRDKDATFKALSSFTKRPINRLRELTEVEASNYINILNEEMKEAAAAEQEHDKPAWGSSS